MRLERGRGVCACSTDDVITSGGQLKFKCHIFTRVSPPSESERQGGRWMLGGRGDAVTPRPLHGRSRRGLLSQVGRNVSSAHFRMPAGGEGAFTSRLKAVRGDGSGRGAGGT